MKKGYIIGLLIFICCSLVFPCTITIAYFTMYKREYTVYFTSFAIMGISSLIMATVALVLSIKEKGGIVTLISVISTVLIIIADLICATAIFQPEIIRYVLGAF